MRSKHVLQPFQYQGSKRAIAPTILEHLQVTHDSMLVEPFAGSAAVSIRAAVDGRGKNFWLNDCNEPLMELWRAILDEPESLMKQYTNLWTSQKSDPKRFYLEVRERFNREHDPADFLYLLARAVKGSIRYNSAGEFNQSPDNRRLGTHPKTLSKRVNLISRVMKCATRVTSMDYRDMLSFYEPGQIWYLDPPYEGVSGLRDSRYANAVERHEFERFLKEMVIAEIPFVLSYDGMTGDRSYGPPLPSALGLQRLELDVGRSTTSTLLGKKEQTIEVIYISYPLQTAIGRDSATTHEQTVMELS